jgi:hypothetical protein
MRSRLVHDERGVALVIAVMTMIVFSILTGAIAIVVTVNQRESQTSANARRAFGIAEVCLADAEGNVYGEAAGAHQTPVSVASPGNCDSDGGTGIFWSNVAGDGVTWTMHGEGTYGGVKRDVNAQANVPGPVTVNDYGVWNYLYADQHNDGATTCDVTITGSTTVSVPTFVRGNLCLQSKFTGSQLGINGNLILQSQGSSHGGVGSATTPISQLDVAGTCNGVRTGTGVCNGSTSPIYASTVSSALGITPGMPAFDTSYYSSTNPGPGSGHGCPVGSSQPANFFDNDTTLNNSDGTINLLPSTNYDCVNGANEIKWCATTTGICAGKSANTLTVNGTFYFDGSLAFSGNTHVVYSGLGSIYVSGTISTAGNFSLCGISNCTASWDTGNNALVLVAGCRPSNSTTGLPLVTFASTGTYCVDYGGTNTVQVGTYCATDYHINGNATNWGPVLANTLTLAGNLSELIPFTVMPPGTPTNTSTSQLPAQAPTYWSG